jgi:hypothetical protein
MKRIRRKMMKGFQQKNLVRFYVFMTMTIKSAFLWYVAPCRRYVNRRFGGTLVHTKSTRHHIQEDGILNKTNILVIKITVEPKWP